MNFIEIFTQYKEELIQGRYITNKDIHPLLENLKKHFDVYTSGCSVQNEPIYTIKLGKGKIKIFMWSQMHGNESTTTKALFDLFNYLKSNTPEAKRILENFTLLCIPILNPDGALAYTRENANNVDLNRDSVDLSQPESRLLRKAFEDFQPNYCFNLHDQRTIYAAGESKNPATVSFLAPAYNETRDYNDNRLKAVEIIVEIKNELQKYIPNQIGRFDDSFNENCIGDTFQKLQVPTVLFEAGHFQNDYVREETRKYIFISYLSALNFLLTESRKQLELKDYLNIPQNKSIFYDFIYKNIKIKNNSLNIITNFAAHYTEVLKNNKIFFEAHIIEIDENLDKVGHVEFDGKGGIYSDNLNNIPQVDNLADFSINSVEFINGLPKKI